MPLHDIAVSGFCRNHHRLGTAFTEFLCLDEDGAQRWDFLIGLAELHWDAQVPGYRDGVIEIPVNVGALIDEVFFTCPVVDVRPTDRFISEYKARRPGEEPRKSSKVCRIDKNGEERKPSPAVWIDIILYRKDVLEEDTSRLDELTGCGWEIVTILGKLDAGKQPMTPGTLMANHFGKDGGTDTQMNPAEFEASLRRSVEFWNGRGMLESPDSAALDGNLRDIYELYLTLFSDDPTGSVEDVATEIRELVALGERLGVDFWDYLTEERPEYELERLRGFLTE